MEATVSPITETYYDVERLIYKTVNDFVQQHGGDPIEYLSAAGEVFLVVYEAYDPDRGAFSTLLVTSLIRKFTAIRNFNWRRIPVWGASADYEVQEGVPLHELHASKEGRVTAVEQLCKHLSDDAAEIVDSLASAVVDMGVYSVHSQRKLCRQALSIYYDEWSRDRLDAAFDEIRGLMGGLS